MNFNEYEHDDLGQAEYELEKERNAQAEYEANLSAQGEAEAEAQKKNLFNKIFLGGYEHIRHAEHLKWCSNYLIYTAIAVGDNDEYYSVQM